jgi:mxaK protein
LKRKAVHGGFVAITLGLTVLAMNYWLEVSAGRAISRTINEIPAALSANDVSFQLHQALRYPETRLALANAYSERGSFEAAEAAFNELIRDKSSAATVRAAQFNLANAYLRQGMRDDLEANQRGPMLELAKQRYRDLLRLYPDDWDVRYNLELALRLAPENDKALAENKGKPIKSVRVIVPDFKVKDLP